MTRRRRVALPTGPTMSGWLRHTLWRNVFHAVGGFRVTGNAPYETMVIAANHNSHADTPALLGAFPSPYKPVVVAADDYWFTHRMRRFVATTLIGVIPVRRNGGGYQSLADGAQGALGRGSSLLIFPEGTRSLDGELGVFHSGAARLATEYDVPLLPVAVVGTHDLLPKRGALNPGPVEIRVGRPIQPEDIDDATMDRVRDQIADLLAQGPAAPSYSLTWRRFRAFMDSPWGLAGAAAWGFAEALVLPVTAEMYLLIFAVAQPRRVMPASAALAAGSVVGVLTNVALTRAGVRVPAPLTTSSMRDKAERDMARGPRGVWSQALNGVPVKLYATAGARLPLPALTAHTVGARSARALGVGLAVGVAAHRSLPFLRRFFGPYEGILALGYGFFFRLVYRAWRRR